MTAATSRTRWPFVGRRGELERFGDALGDGRLEAVLVTGASGVGKSRLAQECLAVAEQLGHPVAHVHATGSASAVPLSALAPLLPTPVDISEPHALFAAVRSRLREQSTRRFVLAVDDIDQLDLVSLALLSFLLADGSLFVVATQRSQTPVPDALEARWRTGSALRMRLDSLERPAVETLLHLALGAPVTAATAGALWEASQGNILYLRELVWCAQADGTLEDADGVWRLRGGLAGSAGIVELVAQRLAGVPAPERSVLELLALCEPLGLDDLLEHVDIRALTGLEEQGLIVVRPDGRRQDITLAHPLHAQALQSAMPRLQARSLLLAQVGRVERRGSRRRGDPLLLASWRMDATGTADPELLVRAARLARYAHDLPRTQRLARAALLHGPDIAASLLLGEALSEQGRHQEAETVFAAAWPSASDGVAALGLARASNLLFGLNLGAQAAACLSELRHRLRSLPDDLATATDPVTATDPARASDAVTAMDALIVGVGAGPEHGLRLLGEVEPPAGPPTDLIMWLRSRAMLLADAGQVDAAAESAQRAHLLHTGVDDRMTVFHPATHLVTLADARLRAGRLDEAQRAAEQGFESALRAESHALIPWFPRQLGRVALARGRVRTAQRLFSEAAGYAEEIDQPAARVAALAGLVHARAYQGALPPDDPLLARLDEMIGAAPRNSALRRARGWALVSQGRLAEGRQQLQSAAQDCLEQGRHADAVALLHDVVRLGGAATAGSELIASTRHVQGEFAAARAAHATATLRSDPVALAVVADRFQVLGARLLAAECLSTAAALHRSGDGQRAAAALLARAAGLVELCEGARTPGLLADTGHVPLSEREREVAALVVLGHSSRDVATALYLSVRTVNNHLQNIYGKLGVNSRAELAAVLGSAGAPRSGQDGPR